MHYSTKSIYIAAMIMPLLTLQRFRIERQQKHQINRFFSSLHACGTISCFQLCGKEENGEADYSFGSRDMK